MRAGTWQDGAKVSEGGHSLLELPACLGPSLEFPEAGGNVKALFPTDSIRPGSQSSPHRKVWACGLPGTYLGDKGHPAGRTWATWRDQWRRLLRPAAACPAHGPRPRLGCGVHCLASRLSSSRWQALAEALVLLPTQARPGPHVLSWASSHHGAAHCTGHCCGCPPGALLGHLGSPCRVSQGPGSTKVEIDQAGQDKDLRCSHRESLRCPCQIFA